MWIDMTVSPLDLNLPQKIVKCWVCKEIYTNPRQLPCLHSFCDRCIDNDDPGQVNCPTGTRCVRKKKYYIILQGGELTCFHFFKSSC